MNIFIIRMVIFISVLCMVGWIEVLVRLVPTIDLRIALVLHGPLYTHSPTVPTALSNGVIRAGGSVV